RRPGYRGAGARIWTPLEGRLRIRYQHRAEAEREQEAPVLENMSHAMVRPAEVCAALLAALEAAEGRRRSRKRDQTPDAIGLAIKRDLLQRVVQEDPSPEAFEAWLLRCVQGCSAPESAGAVSAMARAVFEEWGLAHAMHEFKSWLKQGAPSADADEGKRSRSESQS